MQMVRSVRSSNKVENNHTAIALSIKAATRSLTCSLAFNRRITQSTLEHILFSRINFDKSLFKSLMINNKNYMVLKKMNKHPLLVNFKNMMKNLLTLNDRDELKDVTMIFCNRDDPDNPLESYTLKFDVTENEDNKDVHRIKQLTADLKQTTSDMFDALFCLNDNYQVLDQKDVEIRFVINLRNDADEHPQTRKYLVKYSQADEVVGRVALNQVDQNFPHRFIMGKMTTGYHQVKVYARGTVYEPTTQMAEWSKPTHEANPPREPELSGCVPESYEPTTLMEEATQMDDKANPPRELEISVDCICCVPASYDRIDMLHCKSCSTYQHGVCLGYRNEKEFPKWYLCPKCIPNIEMPSSELAILRLSVVLCYEYKVHPEGLFHVQPFALRPSLLAWFMSNKLFVKINNKLEVNCNVLNENLMKSIFHKPEAS